jgi:predicted RNA binding protein YcfA (HicA-like mRNA interferase family)
MKKNELVRIITKAGAVFVRHGREHDVYRNPRTGKQDYVPRHIEIKENTARAIIKKLSD